MIPGLCSLVYRGNTSGGLSVSVSATNLSGTNGQTTVGPSVASPIGGTAPYTYAWVFYAGNMTVVSDNPTTASSSFSIPSLSPGDSTGAIFYCTVTDAATNSANSTQVFANFSLSS